MATMLAAQSINNAYLSLLDCRRLVAGCNCSQAVQLRSCSSIHAHNINVSQLSLQPLCIFADAGPRGKGGKAPTNPENKAAWESMTKYSVSFLDTSSQKMLRVRVSDHGICVRDIVAFKYADDKGKIGAYNAVDMKRPFRALDDTKKLCESMEMKGLELLFGSQSSVRDGTLHHMFSCGDCYKVVGRSESAFVRHAESHQLIATWENIFACEVRLYVFFRRADYGAPTYSSIDTDLNKSGKSNRSLRGGG